MTVEQILLDRINDLNTQLQTSEIERVELQKLYDETEDQLNMVEDAADYWQEAYAQLFNAIHRAITDANLNETQNVLAVIAVLEKHAGQSQQEVEL